MNLNKKSRTASLALTILLGPIGLLYSSVVGGLVLLVGAIVTLPTIIGPMACWVVAIAIGDHCTHKHNKSVEKFTALVGKNEAD